MTSAPVVLCAPYGDAGASTRVRALEWFRHLGIEAETSTYLDSADLSPATVLADPAAWLRAERRLRQLSRRVGSSRLLLTRMASPFSNGGVESALLRRAATGVYDFDDALMTPRGGMVQSVFSQRRSWAAAVRAADHVVAGNEHLADAASAFNDSVTVIPSCVEPGDYVVKTDHATGASPRAVWLGSPSTEQYLQRIAGSLLVEHRRSGLRVTVISAGSQPLGALEAMVDRVAWRAEDFAQVMATADFGLMPLADGPWERGKCAYKLLQYAAAGLPVVGDPVGANRLALDRLGGSAPGSTDEWVDALQELVDATPERRAELGAAALAGVRRHYSFDAWASTWSRVVLGNA